MAEELARTRRRMIRLGRYLGPQHRAVSHLAGLVLLELIIFKAKGWF